MFKPQKGDRFEGEKRFQPLVMLLSGRFESKERCGEAAYSRGAKVIEK
jgi:hypothetical protein